MKLAADLDDQVAALKLARAHEHIDNLALLLQAYLASEPYRVVQEAIPGGFRLILHVTTKPPPELALVVGDALHKLRSALDVRLVSLAEHLVGPLSEDQERCLQLPDAATPERLAKQTKSWGRQCTPEVVASLRSAVAPLLGHDIDPVYWMERHGGSSSVEERKDARRRRSSTSPGESPIEHRQASSPAFAVACTRLDLRLHERGRGRHLVDQAIAVVGRA